MVVGSAILLCSALATFLGGGLGLRRGRSEGSCGVKGPSQVGTHIVNGSDADKCEWPWQVSLQSSEGRHGCGGVLISPEWVVTAAHCMAGSVDQVSLGMHSRLQQSGDEQVIQIAESFVHPRWFFTGPNDIAMLRLASPAILGDCVGIACFPAADEEAVPDEKCAITGWGKVDKTDAADILQEATVAIVDLETCKKKWRWQLVPRVSDSNVCIGAGDEKFSSACNGDSGGPLVCERASGWTVFGVTSFGDPNGGLCSVRNKPTAYTSLHHHYDWIQEIMSR